MAMEKVNALLSSWGLDAEVQELVNAGFTAVDAAMLVYGAHTRGNAYTANKYKGVIA